MKSKDGICVQQTYLSYLYCYLAFVDSNYKFANRGRKDVGIFVIPSCSTISKMLRRHPLNSAVLDK